MILNIILQIFMRLLKYNKLFDKYINLIEVS
jgi:hypothetical protein